MDESLRSRIQKLAKMTTENGCSIAEAENAARLLLRIASENGLTIDQITSIPESEKAASLTTGDIAAQRKRHHEIQFSINAIADFFDTRGWLWKNTNGTSGVRYMGFPADVEASVALTNILIAAMEREFAAFLNQYRGEVHGRTLRKNYMAGFCASVNSRLKQIKQGHTLATQSTDLVVVKQDIIDKAIADINFRKTRPSSFSGNTAALLAGKEAGNRVDLQVRKEIE